MWSAFLELFCIFISLFEALSCPPLWRVNFSFSEMCLFSSKLQFFPILGFFSKTSPNNDAVEIPNSDFVEAPTFPKFKKILLILVMIWCQLQFFRIWGFRFSAFSLQSRIAKNPEFIFSTKLFFMHYISWFANLLND